MASFENLEEISERMHNKYEKIRLLGTGANGKAYLCLNQSQNQKCVIKQITLNITNEQDIQRQFKEVQILRSLAHPHIIKYQDSFVFKKSYLCIVMDYAQGGDLEKRIQIAQKNNTSFDNTIILKWFTQLCSAVRFIHNQKIIHRDIKNNNIFLDSNNNILLGDFGISKRLNNFMDQANTFIGTPYFMAPEQCNQQPYTNKVDIWALGVVLYRLVYLKYPFEGKELFQLIFTISKGELNFPPKQCSPFKNLITKLLQSDPNQRPTIDQVFEFEEIKQYMDSLRQETQNIQLNNKISNRIPSSNRNRILKESNSRLIQLESNRPESAYNVKVIKETKKPELVLQNDEKMKQVNKIHSRNLSSDLSPGNNQNFNTPKVPQLKQNDQINSELPKQNYSQINQKSSPNIHQLIKEYKNKCENEKISLKHIRSTKQTNQQFSDCSTSESCKELTPKIFLFNKLDDGSPESQSKQIIHTQSKNLKLSNNNTPHKHISQQGRIRFSARKQNFLYKNDPSGIEIPAFTPHVKQDGLKSPLTDPVLTKQNQFHMTKYKKFQVDKQVKPSLNFDHNSEKIDVKVQQKKEYFPSYQQINQTKKNLSKLNKDFLSPKLQSIQQNIPQFLNKYEQKNQNQEFQQLDLNYSQIQKKEEHIDQQMVCSAHTAISQELSKNSQSISGNSSDLIVTNKSIMEMSKIYNNDSNIINNNKNISNKFNNKITSSNNISNNINNSNIEIINISKNTGCISTNLSNNMDNYSNKFNSQSNCSSNFNNYNNFSGNSSNSLKENFINNQNNNILYNLGSYSNRNSFIQQNNINNDVYQFNCNQLHNNKKQFIEKNHNNYQLNKQYITDNEYSQQYEQEDEEDTYHQNNFYSQYFNKVDLSSIINFEQKQKNTHKTSCTQLYQKSQLNNSSQEVNPEQIIDDKKNELIQLLSEELYFKLTHYAIRLTKHYKIDQIMNENLMRKQFIIMCSTEGRKEINFDVNQVIFEILKIVDFEENQLVNI